MGGRAGACTCRPEQTLCESRICSVRWQGFCWRRLLPCRHCLYRDERMVVGLHAVEGLLGVHLQQLLVLSVWWCCVYWRDLLSGRCVLCGHERMGFALPASPSDVPRGSEAAFPCICRLSALAIRQRDAGCGVVLGAPERRACGCRSQRTLIGLHVRKAPWCS